MNKITQRHYPKSQLNINSRRAKINFWVYVHNLHLSESEKVSTSSLTFCIHRSNSK